MVRVAKPLLPFVKVYVGRMASSSIWEEAPETRLLFIWLLGQADDEGYVLRHTPTSIARLANLPLAAVERGLERLEAPDPHSRSPEHDGRRLLRQDDGGWLVVNARRYREMQTPKQAYDAARQRRLRAQQSERDALASSQEREVDAWDRTVGAGNRDWSKPG